MATASTRIASLVLAALLGLCLAGPAPLARADDSAQAPARAADPGAPRDDLPWFVREVPAILFDREFVTWEDDPEIGKPIPHVPTARWLWAEQWTGPGMRAAGGAAEYASPGERFAETETFIKLNPEAAPAPAAGERKIWLPAMSKGQYAQYARAAEEASDPDARALLSAVRDAIRASLPAPAELDTRVFEIASEDWGIPWIAAVPGPESLEAFDRQKAGIDPAGAEDWRHLLGDSFTSADGTVRWFSRAPVALPLYWATLTDRNNPDRTFIRQETWKGAWREPWWDANPAQTEDPGVPDPGFYRGRNWHPALHKWAGWVPGAITSLSNGLDLKLLYNGSTWDDAGYPVVEIPAQPGAEVEIPLQVSLVVAPEASSETPSGPYRVSPEYGLLAAASLDSWTAQGTADNLAAHEMRPVKVKVKAPDQGSLVVYAAVDPRIEEVPFDCNWANNYWAFRITAELPNLYVRNLSLDPNPCSPGEAVSARAEIVNEGSRDVTTVARWIFNDQVVTEQEVSIPAGGYNVTEAQISAPGQAGTYPVGVLANPYQDRPANEANWDDNYAEEALAVVADTVEGSGCGKPVSATRTYRFGSDHKHKEWAYNQNGNRVPVWRSRPHAVSDAFYQQLNLTAELNTGFGPGPEWFAGFPWAQPWGPFGNEIQDPHFTKAGYAFYLKAVTRLETDYGTRPFVCNYQPDADPREIWPTYGWPPAPARVTVEYPFSVQLNGEWVRKVDLVPSVKNPADVVNKEVVWTLPENDSLKGYPVVRTSERLADGDYVIKIRTEPCGWGGALRCERTVTMHVEGTMWDDIYGIPGPTTIIK